VISLAKLGEVMVEVGADLKDFERAMDKVENDLKNTGDILARTGTDISNTFSNNLGNLSNSVGRATNSFTGLSDASRGFYKSTKYFEKLPQHLQPMAEQLRQTQQEFRNLQRNSTQSLEQIQDAVLKTRVGLDKMTSVSSSGKKALKLLEDLRQETNKTRMAVLGFNEDATMKISTEQANVQLKKFQSHIYHVRKELEKLRDEGDFGSYEAGLQQLNHYLRQVDQSMKAVASGGSAVISQLQQMGVITESVGNASAIQMERMKESFIRANEQMQARATQSEKIIKNLQRMDTRNLDQQFLKLGNRLERLARSGMATNLALEILGKNASMKELRDQVMLINQGLMRMQALAMGMAFIMGGWTYALVQASNAMDGRLKPAFEDFKKAWAEAFEPIVKEWTDMALGFLKAGTALGKFTAKLTQANPELAGLIHNILYLAGVFALLNAPMAIGIARGKAFKAAFASSWALIRNFALGLLSVAGTSLIMASALYLGVVSIQKLWKSSEDFRNAVGTLWQEIKNAFLEGTAPIRTEFQNLQGAFDNFMTSLFGGANTASERWKSLGDTIAGVIRMVTPLISTVLTSAFQIASAIIVPILDGLAYAFQKLANYFRNNGSQIQGVVRKISFVVQSVFQSVASFIKSITPVIVDTIKTGFGIIRDIAMIVFPLIAKIVKETFPIIAKVIKAVMPVALALVRQVWTNIRNIITSALNIILNAVRLFKNILQGNWRGAWENVKAILKNAVTLIWNLIQLYFVGRIVGAFRSFAGKAVGALKGLGSKLASPFKQAYSMISGWVSKIRGAVSNMFKGRIKVPRFSVSGSMNPVEWLKGNTPKIRVYWNAKGNIFKGASILGGNIGVGEAGAEVVMPIERKRYMKPYASMVASLLEDMRENPQSTIHNTFHIAQLVVREEADVKRIAQELERIQRQQTRAKGGFVFA
jgi:phage-related protein